MSLKTAKQALRNTFRDIGRNHTMAFAAATLLLLHVEPVPGAHPAGCRLACTLPIPGLFPRILDMMSRMVPAKAMGLVRQISASVISA